ncbi:keratin-associated protein 19-2 [Pongo pygmaeus]|uniref:keratin-associated protein 19-2 n=1 Tax=Pongo abelii TaxID=9601 RepID=UPI0001D6181E|nr:keratin-associated protein 19-2 [Pongo abelii]XP_054324921.1 keratin-associated protein 19-2 [Pongo pygmaeus]
MGYGYSCGYGSFHRLGYGCGYEGCRYGCDHRGCGDGCCCPSCYRGYRFTGFY